MHDLIMTTYGPWRFDLKAPCSTCPFRLNAFPGFIPGFTPEGIIKAIREEDPILCTARLHDPEADDSLAAGILPPTPADIIPPNTAQQCAGAMIFARRMAKLPRHLEFANAVKAIDTNFPILFPERTFLDHHHNLVPEEQKPLVYALEKAKGFQSFVRHLFPGVLRGVLREAGITKTWIENVIRRRMPKTLRNIMVNELKVDEAFIIKAVNAQVTEVLQAALTQEYVQKLILNAIANIVAEQAKGKANPRLVDVDYQFQRYFKDAVAAEVVAQVRKNLHMNMFVSPPVEDNKRTRSVQLEAHSQE